MRIRWVLFNFFIKFIFDKRKNVTREDQTSKEPTNHHLTKNIPFPKVPFGNSDWPSAFLKANLYKLEDSETSIRFLGTKAIGTRQAAGSEVPGKTKLGFPIHQIPRMLRNGTKGGVPILSWTWARKRFGVHKAALKLCSRQLFKEKKTSLMADCIQTFINTLYSLVFTMGRRLRFSA